VVPALKLVLIRTAMVSEYGSGSSTIIRNDVEAGLGGILGSSFESFHYSEIVSSSESAGFSEICLTYNIF
jgi:hypothetical protein